MKRKIVQHGPSTLTISLPSKWVRDHGITKGDELTVNVTKSGLHLMTERGIRFQPTRVSVKGMKEIITKVICALYKRGYDELFVEYDGSDELAEIHKTLSEGVIGFEIISETKDVVHIKKISEPAEEEFKALYRRIFYFLLSLAEEGLQAVEENDVEAYQRLILRDEHINKLSDFCRRVVNKKGQKAYESDTALYHIIEQLEKIGDQYKSINKQLIEQKHSLDKSTIGVYKRTNQLLKNFEELFFSFSLGKIHHLVLEYKKLIEEIRGDEKIFPNEDRQLLYLLHNIATEIYNLSGATMILNL